MFRLSNTQVLVLQHLTGHPEGCTRSDLESAIGVSVTTDVLGVIDTESDLHPDSLHTMGLVSPQVGREETGGTTWIATRKGVKAIQGVQTKRASSGRIPVPVLAKAAARVKAKRTYAFDLFTVEDLKEVVSLLPEQYRDVCSLQDLRSKILNARKAGAFCRPEDAVIASLRKILREYGPDGTVLQGLLKPAQIATVEARLTELTAEPTDE